MRLGEAVAVAGFVMLSAIGCGLPRPPPRQVPWPSLLEGGPHPLVFATPPAAEASIESLARYFAEREPNELLRAVLAHDWIATRVAYDASALEGGPVPDKDYDPEAVFTNRIGVCGGYARLFVRLARALGLEAAYVEGRAWVEGPMKGHAWNAVRAFGRWYLLDVTWDAGSVVGGRFVRRYSKQHLFVDPLHFAREHEPENRGWYMLRSPPEIPSEIVISDHGLLF